MPGKKRKKKIDPKTAKLLTKVGYTKLVEEGVKPLRPDFPDLKSRFNGNGYSRLGK